MESATNGGTVFSALLSDDELVHRVKDLAACERRASVALIRSLAEFDARSLYLREGCSSLFTYCTHVLHLSEGSAYNRIETARAARLYNHANVLCLSNRLLSGDLAKEVLDAWFEPYASETGSLGVAELAAVEARQLGR